MPLGNGRLQQPVFGVFGAGTQLFNAVTPVLAQDARMFARG
jgi:hypothetical protein